MLEPLAVDPNRSVAPAANSIASARLVFPAPAGPTSAITRVPLVDSPAMRLSFVPLRARESLEEALGRPIRKRPPSACFLPLARGLGTALRRIEAEQASSGQVLGSWSIARDIRRAH